MNDELKNEQFNKPPELDIPLIYDTEENGLELMVEKVSFINAKYIKDLQKDFSASYLPVVYILHDNEQLLFSLPLSLSDWVESTNTFESLNESMFPCKVEFGNLVGRVYAEIL